MFPKLKEPKCLAGPLGNEEKVWKGSKRTANWDRFYKDVIDERQQPVVPPKTAAEISLATSHLYL